MLEGDSCIRIRLRHFGLGALAIFTLLLLWLMHVEQSKIDKCIKRVEKQQNPSQIMSTGDSTNKPVQVEILNPISLKNLTNLVNKNEEVQSYVGQGKWDYNWDKKQWKNSSEAIGVPARTIVLVRHGKYTFQTGHLDDKGKIQANLTGARLKQMGMTFSQVIHSPLDRARETAEIILPFLPSNIPVTVDGILEEGGPIPPEPTVSYWGLPQRQYHVDGPRLESAFRKYFYRADKSQTQQSFSLLIGHANTFRFFILRALQLESSAWMRIFISHASISVLHINSDSTVTLTRCGDSGHLPNHLVTY